MSVAPLVSVIVSTRNRPDQIVPCVASIVANQDAHFELVVVDQSDGQDSQLALGRLLEDARVRYVGTSTRGLSRSRNVGLTNAGGPLLLFTDDDCRVPDDWVATTRSLFARDSQLSLAFGSVLLRPEDRAVGYAAEFSPPVAQVIQHSLPDMHEQWGVGANMAMRRSVIDLIGTFDPLLGAGGPLIAAEEIDLTIRALAAGLRVLHTPETHVLHLGIRSGHEASRLMRGYGFGLGAMFAKHVRLGTRGAAAALSEWLRLHGGRSIKNALRGDRQPGFGLVAAVLGGVVASARYGIDREHCHYVRRFHVGH